MTSDELLNYGEQLFKREKFSEASSVVSEAIDSGLDKDEPERTFEWLAKAYFLAGEISAASAINRQISPGWIAKYAVYAYRCFKKSLEYNAENAEAYHRIACLMAGMGDQEALEYFDKALELAPSNFDYWYNKADTMFKLSDKLPRPYSKEADGGKVGTASIINFDTVIANMTEAIKCMDRSIELRKASGDRLDLAVGYDTRGRMYEGLAVFESEFENLQKAKWDYVKAAELSETFLGNLARVRRNLNKYDTIEKGIKNDRPNGRNIDI